MRLDIARAVAECHTRIMSNPPSQDPTAEPLGTIVKRAYDIFPAERLTGLGVCNCGICMDDRSQRAMAESDRADITVEMLRAFFDAATADSGLVPRNVARHLVPRILQMIAEGEEVFEAETYLERFELAEDANWTEPQNDLIASFRIAYIDSFKGEARGIEPMLDDVLCMFAKGGFDLVPIMAQIENWSTQNLIDRFWVDWCSWCSPGVWRTAFWSPVSDREADALRASEKLTADWYRDLGRHVLDQVFDDAPENTRLWQRAADVEVALSYFDES